jgi:hypothetical protein
VRNVIIMVTGLISFSLITIITLYLFISINKSIIIYDYNKILSKTVSWYFNKEITFEFIKIKSLQEDQNYILEISNLATKNYKNYKSVKLDNIKFNINLNKILKTKYYFSNIEVNNPNIVYQFKDRATNRDIVISMIENFLTNIDVLKVFNGNILFYDNEKIHYISKLNLNKKGLTDLNILGEFTYRDNYLYKDEKNILFRADKSENRNYINIKFSELSLPNFLLNKVHLKNKLNIKGTFYGEISLFIKNNKILNIELNIYSNAVNINIKENLQYANIFNSNNLKFKNISLNILYDFNSSYLRINNMTFVIKNNEDVDKDTKFVFTGERFFNSSIYNINFVFDNLSLKTLLNSKNERYKFYAKDIISGEGSISSLDKKIIFNVADTSFKNIYIRDINFIYNNSDKVSNLNFSVEGDYFHILSFSKRININDNIFNNLLKEDITGYMDINFNINFPDISKSYDDYYTDIKVNLIEGTIINKYLKKTIDIDTVNLKIFFDKKKIDFIGNAKVNNTYIYFNYFKFKNGEIDFNFNLNFDNELIVNSNFLNNFKGNSAINCNIKSEYKILLYFCNVDLKDTSLTIPYLGYNKNFNEQASLNFDGILTENFSFDKTNFNFYDKSNLLKGHFNYDSFSNSYYINFNEFILDKNNLKLEFIYKNNNVDIDIFSGVLNLSPFMNFRSNFKENIIPSIKVNAVLNELIIFDSITLGDSNLLYINNDLYKEFSIESEYYSNETINFNINNTDNKQIFSYNFIASNAGKFFNIFNYNTEIKDGVLSSEGFLGNLDYDNDIMGTVSIDNFKLMKAPLLAELLLAASLTGLVEVFNNEGITFDQFDAQFIGKNNIYTISKSRAYGFSLGLTGEGYVDSFDKSVQINGSIVPAYKLNTLFNNIPIIGEILSAKEDEGIFAINYSAMGKWNDPEIEVNPLSMLTPGILRNIFDY